MPTLLETRNPKLETIFTDTLPEWCCEDRRER